MPLIPAESIVEHPTRYLRARRVLGLCSKSLVLVQPVVLVLLATQPPALAQQAPALLARHEALREQLSANQFERPLHLESSEGDGKLAGDVYAQLDQNYDIAGPALEGIANWCDILILHLNVKSCHASTDKSQLSVRLGRKNHESLQDAYPIVFDFRIENTTSNYLKVTLNADAGPLGTSDYRIILELAALKGGGSFLHLAYAYAYGLSARMATEAYLSTIGRDKQGFTLLNTRADGEPVYVDGLRGAIERNTMRYYLAIEAYLGTLAPSADATVERRLQAWFSATERYPRQLHELERDEYLSMKHREIEAQKAVSHPPAVNHAH